MENRGLGQKGPAGRSSKRYLFLHVPKTAGSMFRGIVHQNFGNEAAIENPFYSKHIYSASQIDSLFDLYPYRIYSGHVFRLLPALEAHGGMLNLIAFVRDPIEKARSAYYYLAEREMTRADHLVKRHSFVQMVDYVIANNVEDSFVLDSSQLDWLVGQNQASVDPVADAVRTGRLALFPTEQFDLACVLLERLFEHDFVDCSYRAKQNVSQKKASKDPDNERAVARRLPWIARDSALHEYARDNIASLSRDLLGAAPAVDAALQEFRDRCARRSQTTEQRSGHKDVKGARSMSLLRTLKDIARRVP